MDEELWGKAQMWADDDVANGDCTPEERDNRAEQYYDILLAA